MINKDHKDFGPVKSSSMTEVIVVIESLMLALVMGLPFNAWLEYQQRYYVKEQEQQSSL